MPRVRANKKIIQLFVVVHLFHIYFVAVCGLRTKLLPETHVDKKHLDGRRRRGLISNHLNAMYITRPNHARRSLLSVGRSQKNALHLPRMLFENNSSSRDRWTKIVLLGKRTVSQNIAPLLLLQKPIEWPFGKKSAWTRFIGKQTAFLSLERVVCRGHSTSTDNPVKWSSSGQGNHSYVDYFSLYKKNVLDSIVTRWSVSTVHVTSHHRIRQV